MSCHSSFHRSLKCLPITDFSYHHNIWILSQWSTQTISKLIANISTNLTLIKSFNTWLYWIFVGGNIDTYPIYFVQRSIQRCCLTTTSRSWVNNNPIWISQISGHNQTIRSFDTKRLQWWCLFGFIYDTHYQLLSPYGWKCIGTQVDLFASEGDSRYSGILRNTLFIRSHLPWLNLKLGNDIFMHGTRILHNIIQHSIDTQSDTAVVFVRLNMDIWCVIFYSNRQQIIKNLHNIWLIDCELKILGVDTNWNGHNWIV